MVKILENQIVKIPQKALKKGVVLLDLEEYKKMQTREIPTFNLEGKEAEELDKLVDEGLKEYERGETIEASSLREALKIYERGENKKH
jgi:hypothetical protein